MLDALTLYKTRGFQMADLLIVDDEKNIRESLTSFLTGCGHQVTDAESSRQALEILSHSEGKVDLVLSDWRMASNKYAIAKTNARISTQLVVLHASASWAASHAITAAPGPGAP